MAMYFVLISLLTLLYGGWVLYRAAVKGYPFLKAFNPRYTSSSQHIHELVAKQRQEMNASSPMMPQK